MKYFLYKLKTLKVHIVAVCLFSFASYPLFGIAFADYSKAYAFREKSRLSGLNLSTPEFLQLDRELNDKASTTMFMAVIGLIALVALFTTGIPILMKCFGYLQKKPRADMEMSAPVTPVARFFGNFFAGLTAYLVPHIIAALVGLAIIGGNYGEPTVDWVCVVIGRMMIYGLMMCVLFYCTTTLIVAVCGRTRTAVITTLVMNLAVPAITFGAGVLSFRFGLGLTEGLVDEMFGKVGWFTPLGLLVKFFVQGIFGTKSGGAVEIPQMLLFLLYCAVFVAAAYFLVKRRRHERTGSAYVFRYARHVFAAATVLAATMTIAAEVVVSMNENNYLWQGISASTVAGMIAVDIVLWLVAAFGFFCAFEFGGSKGERNRKKRFILYAPFIVGSALVTFISAFTQGFGAACYVPDVSEILTANLDVRVGDVWYYSDGSPFFHGDGYDKIEPDMITELHRDIISKNSAGSGMLDVTYKLRNGENITRYYRVSDEFLERAFDINKGTQSLLRFDEDDIIPEDTVTVIRRYDYKNEKCAENIPMKEFVDAFNADCSAVTFEQAKKINSQSGRSIEISFNYWYGSRNSDKTGTTTVWKQIFPFYNNTLALLEKYGLSQNDIFRR